MSYTVQEFLDIIKPMAQQAMMATGVLASLTVAQAYLESGYGNSRLSQEGNNLFGMKGEYDGDYVLLPTTEYEGTTRKTVIAKFKKYPSWTESLKDHSRLFQKRKRYAQVLVATEYKQACHAVADAGYATHPTYAEKLIEIIEKYQLYEFDDTQAVTPEKKVIVGAIDVKLNGTVKKVETINLDGYNYIKLRDLADESIKIDYDATHKLPVIQTH